MDGSLVSLGTAASPVVFTSERDDAYGGDTNGDADLTSPAPSDWGYIKLNSDTSQLNHAVLRYGGYKADNYPNYCASEWRNYMVWIDGASPTVANSTFEHAYDVAVYVGGGELAAPLISANTFSGGFAAVWADNAVPVIENNSIIESLEPFRQTGALLPEQ